MYANNITFWQNDNERQVRNYSDDVVPFQLLAIILPATARLSPSRKQ